MTNFTPSQLGTPAETPLCQQCGQKDHGTNDCRAIPVIANTERLNYLISPIIRDWNTPEEDEAWKNL